MLGINMQFGSINGMALPKVRIKQSLNRCIHKSGQIVNKPFCRYYILNILLRSICSPEVLLGVSNEICFSRQYYLDVDQHMKHNVYKQSLKFI